jgi:peptide/nickel transport system substrate-binding protein
VATVALAAATAVLVGTTVAPASSGKSSAVKAGGTYRVGWADNFGFTDGFDPTGEYLGDSWGIFSNLMVRTLVGYNHTSGPDGAKIVPDIAISVPKPTNGGKTYTFRLKSGVKFGPPVSRAVTSQDIAYAMQRLANPKDGGQYAFYYDDKASGAIKGWNAYASGKAKTISGITTPNARTIVFNLTKPEGDFIYRMAMPATGPIPKEVASCFEGKAGAYGRDVVSTGPYMIQGADSVDISSCGAIKPMSGFDGQANLTLVRNPDYNPATDSKKAREALPDSFVFTVNSNADDIANQIKAGTLDDNEVTPDSKTIREYATNPSLKSRLHFNSADGTYYLTMNLTQPPFDDIHVRKAMNYIMDKQGLRKAWGGPVGGQIATHIVPDDLEGNLLKGWDPYATPNSQGSLAKAMAEMKQSKYDPGHTGKCTASACKGVLMIADSRPQDPQMVPVIQAAAAKIGITFTVRTVKGAYPVIQTPSKNIPFSERPRWLKDYADALTFFAALFTSGAIIPSGNTNYSLVGITPAIAKKVGVKGNLTNVPSIDSIYNKCDASVGDIRLACWAGLDKTLMTKVVPWVPYMWLNQVHTLGPKVTKWDFDQFSTTTAFAHVAVSG